MNVKRLLAAAALAAASLGLAAAPAFPNNTSPHQEEQDGCDHGATSKDCRPDPSENGKDCEPHGNHGGVNEDHCVQVPGEEVTTTTSSSTTTTAPVVIVGDPVDVVETPPADVTPNLGCTTPDGFPYLTNIEQGGCSGPGVADLNDVKATRVVELAHTGTNPAALIVAGFALIMLGVALRSAVTNR